MTKPYLHSTIAAKLKGLVYGVKKLRNTAVCFRIAKVNDNYHITDDRRKEKLAQLFAKIGWKPVYR